MLSCFLHTDLVFVLYSPFIDGFSFMYSNCVIIPLFVNINHSFHTSAFHALALSVLASQFHIAHKVSILSTTLKNNTFDRSMV